MVRVRYYVVKAGSFWKITFNGRDYHFDERARAIKVAIDTARKVGGNAQVLVRGRDGNWLLEWSHGHDPYPPTIG